MRTVQHHLVKRDVKENQITIEVVDLPGAGGANHKYRCVYPAGTEAFINFQNGPIKENGVNGITQEVLIAICMDRLESFQKGNFACEDNASALEHLQFAMNYLKKRTIDRISRGVEGVSVL